MVELQENGNKACDPGTQRLHSPLQSSHRARLKGQDMEEGPEPRGPRQGDLTQPWGDPRSPDGALLHSSTSWGLAHRPVVCEAFILRENCRLETDPSGMCRYHCLPRGRSARLLWHIPLGLQLRIDDLLAYGARWDYVRKHWNSCAALGPITEKGPPDLLGCFELSCGFPHSRVDLLTPVP